MTIAPITLAPAQRAVELIGGDLTEKSLRLHLEGLAGVDAVGLEQRAADLGSRSIKTTSKARALDTIGDPRARLAARREAWWAVDLD